MDTQLRQGLPIAETPFTTCGRGCSHLGPLPFARLPFVLTALSPSFDMPEEIWPAAEPPDSLRILRRSSHISWHLSAASSRAAVSSSVHTSRKVSGLPKMVFIKEMCRCLRQGGNFSTPAQSANLQGRESKWQACLEVFYSQTLPRQIGWGVLISHPSSRGVS